MEGTTKRKSWAMRALLASAAVVAVLTIFFSLNGGTSQDTAEAVSGGPEMGLLVKSGSTTCPMGTPPNTTCVTAGGTFSISVRAIGIPAGGYILAQSFLDYGIFNPTASEDGAGANTCSDTNDNGGGDGADRLDPDCVTVHLTYKPGNLTVFPGDPNGELVWPDVEDATAQRSTALGPGTVLHGALSGLINPPASNYIGNLYLLDFNCSAASSTTPIKILPNGDPLALTNGAVYVQHGTNQQIIPKVGTRNIRCLGPTPTPTHTPVPPTNTPTISPTPTNTATPLPPPSERPDVKVTKVDLQDPVDSGGALNYSITVESIGLQTAEDVVVEDVLPPGAVFKSASGAGATCGHDSGVVTCTINSPMDPDDIIKINLQTNAPTGTDALVDNNVTVTSSNEPFANTGNNKDLEQTVVLAPRSDVTLQKTGEPTFLDGKEDVTYTLVAKNLGPHEAENVQIVDTLPEDATFVSATNPECGAPVLDVVTCDVGNLAVNQEAIVEIVLTAPNVTRSVFLKNSAVVSADNELFLQTGNNLAIANTAVIAPPPDLVVTKDDSADPVLRYREFSYDITVDNIGLGDALDVVVTDTLPTVIVGPFNIPNTMEFVSAVGADCAEGPPGTVVCTIDEVNVGDPAVVITLNVRSNTLLEDDTAVNSVTASASDPDENPAGNDDSESTLIRACFDVAGPGMTGPDGVVDLANDILTVILHAPSFEGDLVYDPLYDFDGDGSIGLPYDILPTILHHAQDCTLLV